MPGLINRMTSTALPLVSSEVTSYVSGYAFGMTASLSYGNSENYPFEGLFVYLLDEYTTVVGFEAVIAERVVTVLIKDKARIDDCYFSCCNVPNGRPPDEEGYIVLDEDLERILFVVNVGIVPPQTNVSICISTSSELQTLPSGAVRVLLPAVCVPRVSQKTADATASFSGHHLPLDRHYCGTVSSEQAGKFCLAHLLELEATNPVEYEFSFCLEIRGPCLLAGVESPTHEIRADADPSARSAKSIMITLANKHTFDRPVEILIHPSEPHLPHVLMEEGDMSPMVYEQHLRGRNDFIKGTKKDSSAEKKTEIIRKRLHKDIPHHPVIMLNFCPDLRSVQPNFRKTHGEFIFLVDRSGSMSGTNITRVKEALLVIMKSLMPKCLFNIIGFGSTFKALFPSSQTYSEENLALACESIKKFRADMGGTNLLSPLKWLIRQPIHRGHPRLLFLLTDGSVSNTGTVLELLRNHAFSTRCYTFGIGWNACRRLLKGLAAVSNGSAEFLAEGERVQPKMIRSLKKAMAPMVSDVSVDWVFPETTEVLISPVNTSCLFPGDRLVGYSVVCDTSLYISNPRLDKRRRYSMIHSQGSGSSVFFHSQEEAGNLDNWEAAKDREGRFPSERSPELLGMSRGIGSESDIDPGVDPTTCSRRRAYSTNQIADGVLFQKFQTASDSSSTLVRNPLRKVQLQDLSLINSELQSWQVEVKPFTASPISAAKIRGTGARRPSLLQEKHLALCHQLDSPQLPGGTMPIAVGSGSGQQETGSLLGSTFSESRSPGDLESAQHPSFNFETESTSDWELHDLDLSSSGGSFQSSSKSLCKAVVKGLQNNEPVKWEITFDLGPLFQSRENKGEEEEDVWNETFHQLAAKSIVQDFEQLAERESEIEHGSGRRYQVNAVHTSKSCNVISKYTAFLPVDLSSNSHLPTVVKYPNTGLLVKSSSQRSSGSESRRRGLSADLGRTQNRVEDGLCNTNTEENILSPCSTPSSSGWDRYSFPDAPLRSPSITSQKSVENFFAARLALNKTRLLTRAARGFMGKVSAKTSDLHLERDSENVDYLPLVSLQMACGSFPLNKAFSEAINIPLEKLRWTSPFACHRVDLSPSASSRKLEGSGQAKSSGGDILGRNLHKSIENEAAPPSHPSGGTEKSFSQAPKAEKKLTPPSITIQSFSTPDSAPSVRAPSLDSGRGSDTESSELQAGVLDGELPQQAEPEGMIWATAVALAWLEHSSAAYFIEWELVAAKASRWLSEQDVPEGRNLPAVKTTAQQLFVLLRHWDENLQFNLLCYNPKDV